MSVLSDRDLKRRLPGRFTGADRSDFHYVDPIISPYAEDRVQPSSYDVALGSSFRVPEYHDVLMVDLADPPTGMMKEINIADDGYLMIHPGDFVLASTEEWVDLPNDLVCRLEGKSSVGRLGLLIHATAGFIDPGFKGNITLEMTNFLRVPIQVKPGQMIAQLAFQTLTSEVEHPYSGRYQGDKGATESRYGLPVANPGTWVSRKSMERQMEEPRSEWERQQENQRPDPSSTPFDKPGVMSGYPMDDDERKAVDRIVKDSEGR